MSFLKPINEGFPYPVRGVLIFSEDTAEYVPKHSKYPTK